MADPEAEDPSATGSTAAEAPETEAQQQRRRRGRPAGSTNQQPVADADGEPVLRGELARIRKDLAGEIGWLGMAMSVAFPLTGVVVVSRADVASEALCELATKDRRLLRILRQLSKGGAYVKIAGVVGDVVIAVGVERGIIPVNHILTGNIQPEIQATLAAQAAAAAQAQGPPGSPQSPSNGPTIYPGGSIGTEAERAASQA